MRGKVLIIDTSILCVWLKVKDLESCGPDGDQWDYTRINDKINDEISNGAKLVLPIATIIETGNHITHARGDNYDSCNRLVEVIEGAADEKTPWMAFSIQKDLWSPDKLKALAYRWRESVKTLSIGDVSIVDVANFYHNFSDVEILTGDTGLKSYEPIDRIPVPRRRN